MISIKKMRQNKTMSKLKQKNIDFAAEAVAETVFYHFTDSTQKEKLKTALKMFANMILLPDTETKKRGKKTNT